MMYKQISHNITVLNRSKSDIKYIVIHDTGNTSSGANAEMHYRYFNGANRNASADIFVDDKQVLKINDYYKFYSWAVGDGRGSYGITNRNSISVELCINSNGNYEKMCESAVIVARSLMSELGIPTERVIRHYDASRKICPGTFSASDWARWKQFKNRISNNGELPPLLSSSKQLQTNLNVLGYGLVVDGIVGTKTKEAVKDFQSFFGLQVDGIVGPITSGKIIDAMIRKGNKRPPF